MSGDGSYNCASDCECCLGHGYGNCLNGPVGGHISLACRLRVRTSTPLLPPSPSLSLPAPVRPAGIVPNAERRLGRLGDGIVIIAGWLKRPTRRVMARGCGSSGGLPVAGLLPICLGPNDRGREGDCGTLGEVCHCPCAPIASCCNRSRHENQSLCLLDSPDSCCDKISLTSGGCFGGFSIYFAPLVY